MSRGGFEVHIKNFPKYLDVGAVKKFLKDKLDNLSPERYSIMKDHAYVSFSSEEDACSAAAALDGASLKNRALKVVKKWERQRTAAGAAPPAKRPKLVVDPTEIMGKWEEVVQDNATPLWRKSYEDTLEQKQRDCEATLRRVSTAIDQPWDGALLGAGLRETIGQLERIRPCPIVKGGRNKAEFTIGLDPTGKTTIGFRVGKYKDLEAFVLPVDPCSNIPESMKRICKDFQRYLDKSEHPPFNANDNSGVWKQVLVRATQFDVLVAVAVNPAEMTEDALEIVKTDMRMMFMENDPVASGYRVTSLYLQRVAKASDSKQFELVAGAPYIYETLLASKRFRISPDSFFQTNTAAAEMLYGIIAEVCQLNPKTYLLDICSGAGTIGICLADRVGYVLGVEIVESAVADSNQSAVNHGLSQKCSFVCDKAENFMDNIKADERMKEMNCDNLVAVVDPPRAGLPTKLIGELRRMDSLSKVCYVSCDPKAATKNFVDLARPPSKKFPGNPFKLVKVIPADMFPFTVHFEWVMLFER